MVATKKVFYFNKWDRAVCRGKELCRRLSVKIRRALEVLRKKSPQGLSTKELIEETDDPYVSEKLRRLYHSDPDTWSRVFHTPEKPHGEFRMFDRDSGPNQNRGGGFGPRRF